MTITYFETTTSTNDDAKKMAENGGKHLDCVWSNRQTKGRGRLGRKWRTYPDHSVAASFVIREGGCPQLPLMMSLAVCQVVEKYSNCSIKWPNDILCNGQKISGILVEKFGSKDPYYIVGVGVNISKPEEELIGTCLENESGQRIDRRVFLEQLQDVIQKVCKQGWNGVREEYISKCVTLGQDVHWLRGENIVNGRAKEIDEEGALILSLENGTSAKVISGEIIAQSQK